MEIEYRRLFVACVVVALSLSACRSGGSVSDTTTLGVATTTTAPASTSLDVQSPANNGETEVGALLIWTDAQRAPAIEMVAPAFTEATGVEVTVEIQEFGGIKELATAAGPIGEGPDVFIGAHDWTGELVANGIVGSIDLTPLVGTVHPKSIEAFTVDSTTYGLPVAIETIGLYRNTDLVPEAPTTFEEIAETCDALDGVESCVGLAGDVYHNYFWLSGPGGYIFRYDEGVGFDPTDVGLDNEGAIAGVSFLAAQVAAGTVGASDYDTAKNLFLAGTQPFWITGPWELVDLSSQDAVAWAASDLPTVAGTTPAPMVAVQGFFLSAFGENQDMARSFLLDYVATTDTMQQIFDIDRRPPVFDGVDAGGDQDAIDAFLESAADGYVMPNIPEMGLVWGPLGASLLLVRNGEASPEGAMVTAADAVRAALEG